MQSSLLILGLIFLGLGLVFISPWKWKRVPDKLQDYMTAWRSRVGFVPYLLNKSYFFITGFLVLIYLIFPWTWVLGIGIASYLVVALYLFLKQRSLKREDDQDLELNRIRKSMRSTTSLYILHVLGMMTYFFRTG